VLQVVAGEHNQRSEDEEARAEDDQAGVDADGEVGGKTVMGRKGISRSGFLWALAEV
jgi:hypothetical protein